MPDSNLMDPSGSKVAVIVPVYNLEHYIAEAMRSILEQSFSKFRVYVIDDGSTDRSIEIINYFHDSRIQILRQKNQGLAAARNAGIRASCEPYIAYLDGDDVWLPEKLSRHVEHLDHHPQVGLSYCWSEFIDDRGRPMHLRQISKTRDISVEDLLLQNPVGNGSIIVLRRAAMESVAFEQNGRTSYFDETFRRMEDVDCWLRMLTTTNWKIEGIGEILCQYRLRRMSLSATIEDLLIYWNRMFEKMGSYAPAHQLYRQQATSQMLRFLAQRAVLMGKTPNDMTSLLWRSIQMNPRAIWEHPLSILAITAGAGLRSALGEAAYEQTFRSISRVAGTLQRLGTITR